MRCLLASLLFFLVLAGCADPPPIADTPCCAAPAPGTITVHSNAEVLGGMAVRSR
jgi:hypothetical protein